MNHNFRYVMKHYNLNLWSKLKTDPADSVDHMKVGKAVAGDHFPGMLGNDHRHRTRGGITFSDSCGPNFSSGK